MDSINDIISSLSADDIEMLKGVANSLLSNNDSNNLNNKVNYNSNNNNQGLLNLLNGSNNGNEQLNTNSNTLVPGLSTSDLNIILKAKSIFEKMKNNSSKNADLIIALKPHLSEKYKDKADQAIKMLQLFEALPYLKELF